MGVFRVQKKSGPSWSRCDVSLTLCRDMPLGRIDSVARRPMGRGIPAVDTHALQGIWERFSQCLLTCARVHMLERLEAATRLFALLFTLAAFPVRHSVLRLERNRASPDSCGRK